MIDAFLREFQVDKFNHLPKEARQAVANVVDSILKSPYYGIYGYPSYKGDWRTRELPIEDGTKDETPILVVFDEDGPPDEPIDLIEEPRLLDTLRKAWKDKNGEG